MSYEIIDPRIMPELEFVQRLAEIADRAWHGYSEHPLSWRYNYYSALASYWPTAQHFFRIITFNDERRGMVEDCAFTTVFPMKSDACRLHRRGSLSQYEFASSDFGISRSRTTKSFHYIQSVFNERSHRHSFILRKLLNECIFKLLREQYCGFCARPYEVYAETSMRQGRELALNHGFIESGEYSHEGRPFFVFDSELRSGEIANHIRKSWGTSFP